MRYLWIADGKDKGYSNSEINDISDNHDMAIDYLIFAAYPIASSKILNDPLVVSSTKESYALNSEGNFIKKTKEYLQPRGEATLT